DVVALYRARPSGDANARHSVGGDHVTPGRDIAAANSLIRCQGLNEDAVAAIAQGAGSGGVHADVVVQDEVVRGKYSKNPSGAGETDAVAGVARDDVASIRADVANGVVREGYQNAVAAVAFVGRPRGICADEIACDQVIRRGDNDAV